VELNTYLDINQHIWGPGGRSASGLDGGALAGHGGAGGSAGGASAGGGAGSRPDGAGDAEASAEGLARLARGEVSVDDFELLKVLGKGSFGKVFLVRLLLTGQIYAMKVLKKSEVMRRRQVEHTKAERRIMGAIDHPFIVSLRFAFASADKLYMVTDYCRGGELFFHLKKFRTFPEAMVRFFAAELVLALSHLHSLDVVYRCVPLRLLLLQLPCVWLRTPAAAAAAVRVGACMQNKPVPRTAPREGGRVACAGAPPAQAPAALARAAAAALWAGDA